MQQKAASVLNKSSIIDVLVVGQLFYDTAVAGHALTLFSVFIGTF